MTTDTEDTLLEFPCEFPLKAMGRRCDEFEIAVITIVRKHIENLGEGAVRSRDNGKFTSITVTFEAHSKKQLDDLYRELHAHELVLMLL